MSQEISLKIILDNNDCRTVQAGGCIQGNIVGIVREKILEPTNDLIEVYFEVVEMGWIREKIRQAKAYRRLHCETRIIKDHFFKNNTAREGTTSTTTVFHPKLCLNPGIYYFPFQFQIPKHLPGTLSRIKKEENHKVVFTEFHIRYSLTLKVGSRIQQTVNLTVFTKPDEEKEFENDMNTTNTNADTTTTTTPTALLTMGPELVPMNENYRDIGYAALGCAIRINSNSKIVKKGETINCSISCRNLSKIDIIRIHVKLIETYHWMTALTVDKIKKVLFPPVEVQEEKVLVSATIVGEEEGVNHNNHNIYKLPSVQLESTCSSNEDVTKLATITFYDEIEDEMINELSCISTSSSSSSMEKDNSNSIQLCIPETTEDTYQGPLMHISHYIRIECETNFSSSSSHPSIRIPLIIKESKSSIETKTKEITQALLLEEAEKAAIEGAKAAAAAAALVEETLPPAQPNFLSEWSERTFRFHTRRNTENSSMSGSMATVMNSLKDDENITASNDNNDDDTTNNDDDITMINKGNEANESILDDEEVEAIITKVGNISVV